MRGWVLGALCALCSLGCGGGEETSAPRASTRGRPPSADPPPAAAPPAEPTPAPAKPAFTEPFPFEQLNKPAAAPAAPAQAAPPEKERSYGAELLAALSGSQSCVQPRSAAETLPVEVQVAIEAHVLESGMVSRGYARSTYLNADELKCIERRVESARLPGGVKEAPRRVETQIKLSFPRAPAPAGGGAAPAPGAAPGAATSPPSY